MRFLNVILQRESFESFGAESLIQKFEPKVFRVFSEIPECRITFYGPAIVWVQYSTRRTIFWSKPGVLIKSSQSSCTMWTQ